MKIDEFKGRIDFHKDAPDKIQQTLKRLRQYLEKYEEYDAAEIVANFDPKNLNKPKSAVAERMVHAYEKRTEVLEKLHSTFAKISEDMIDEQKTEAKVGKSKWKDPDAKINKASLIFDKLRNATYSITNEVLGFMSDPVQWVQNLILERIVGRLIGVIWRGSKFLVRGLIVSTLGLLLKSGGMLFGQLYNGLKLVLTKGVKSAVAAGITSIKNASKISISKVTKFVKASSVGRLLDIMSGYAGTAMDMAVKGYNAAKTLVKKSYNKTIKYLGKGVEALGSKLSTLKFGKIIDKVKGVATKIVKYFAKKPGVGMKIAGALSKSLTKVAGKFVPIIGWAFLAYDVYRAVKDSNGGVVSFAINLLDNLGGGLISVFAEDAALKAGFSNVGDYLADMIKKGGQEYADAESDKLLDEIDLDSLEGTAKTLKILDSMAFSGTDRDRIKLQKALEGSPHQTAIVNKYSELTRQVLSRQTTQQKASEIFRQFITKTLKIEQPKSEVSVYKNNNQSQNITIPRTSELPAEKYDVKTAAEVKQTVDTVKLIVAAKEDTKNEILGAVVPLMMKQQNNTNLFFSTGNSTPGIQGS